tara:strand:+ start:181 stop:792 length:612 start_codon:yes stop_codon:yes gene_type:complete
MAKDSRKFKKIKTNTVTYVDDRKITFGDDTDLEIYHTATGNETHIDGKNSRPVYIRAKDLYITNAAGDDKAIHVDGGAGGGAQTVVKLYHDDVEKFKTHASGFQFTGTPTEGLNNLGTLTGGGTVNIDLALGNVAMAYIDDAPVTFTFSGYDETAGVVSTNPAYLMNEDLEGTNVAVALTGRVPVKVTGTIRKGDMLVSAGEG